MIMPPHLKVDRQMFPMLEHVLSGVHPIGGGAAGLQLPQIPQNLNLENSLFVETMISKVLRHLPFNRCQPLNSADD